MAINICATGAYVPPHTVDNEQLASIVDTSDAWIRQRVGIQRRHIAKDETTTDFAYMAARQAIETAGVEPEEIDMILVATMSSDTNLPSMACAVQARLGALHAVCFDINAACAGFLVALQTAESFLETMHMRYILVIGSECLSKVVDWNDRSTCILFGDGAGAALVDNRGTRRFVSAIHSDGSKGTALRCAGISAEQSIWDLLQEKETKQERTVSKIQMDGQAVFKFAVKKVPEVIDEVLKENHLKTGDIACYLLHQANERIVTAVAKRLGEPIEKFPMNVAEYGNTAAASIPLLLDELAKKKKLASGDKIVLAGFGGGLTWGAKILEWIGNCETR